MRFSTQVVSLFHLIGFLSLTTASSDGVNRQPPSLVRRDLATVTGVFDDVGSGIDELDSAVKAFKGDSDPVVDTAENLVNVINGGKTEVDKSDDLSLTDALALQDPVRSLTNKAEALTNDLKAKKTAFQEAGLCVTTRSQISEINGASQKLINLTDVLNGAQDSFSESKCRDKENSSTSKQVVSTTELATALEETGSLSCTAENTIILASESTNLPTSSAVASTSNNTDKPYPPMIPTATGNFGTVTPTPSLATAGASFIVPAGFLVLGMAAMLI
ncbi:hypothetical protein NW762_014150 [Fusarium torreyae]|uniref:Cell wall protein n=1 Tax=Fusarium torreyae TaxID=1237075 RepID=A0A9W8V838_9HYPO|nr:hypothetical protein NW762_014150 [Fusarium torreyae]